MTNTSETSANKMKVQITLYREKTFTRKYGSAVKAAGGSYTHCRGNEWDREVTIPCYGNEELIKAICFDLSLFRNEQWAQDFVFIFTVGGKVYRRNIYGRPYADALKSAEASKELQEENLALEQCPITNTNNTPAPAEAPAEATAEATAEELDSDAFKAFAAEMKALLADVPEALPAYMSDAHTLLCVQFSVDKRQHKPCKQYEWGKEFAQCGAELTVQQGIMQFTVPLQTSRQRELFKTLHECSILDDPEMEGARQYLFTQVVLPLARWGCTSEPQVNTALIECMYYEGAGAIMKAGYLACTSKLQ